MCSGVDGVRVVVAVDETNGQAAAVPLRVTVGCASVEQPYMDTRHALRASWHLGNMHVRRQDKGAVEVTPMFRGSTQKRAEEETGPWHKYRTRVNQKCVT